MIEKNIIIVIMSSKINQSKINQSKINQSDINILPEINTESSCDTCNTCDSVLESSNLFLSSKSILI